MIPENVRDEETTGLATIIIVQTEGNEAKVRLDGQDPKAKALSVEVELIRKFMRSSIQSSDRCHSAHPLKRSIILQVVLQVVDTPIQRERSI